MSDSEDEMTTSSSENDSDDQINSTVDESSSAILRKHASNNTMMNNGKKEYNLVDMLKGSDYNWFQFVMVLRDAMKDTMEEAVDKVLEHFGETLSSLHLTEHKQMIVEQFRQAYLISSKKRERESAADDLIIVSSHSEDSSTELLTAKGIPNSPMDELVLTLLQKRRAAIRRKAVREMKVKIVAQRFLRRRRSKKVSRTIGEAIEAYVRECGVGANAW